VCCYLGVDHDTLACTIRTRLQNKKVLIGGGGAAGGASRELSLALEREKSHQRKQQELRDLRISTITLSQSSFLISLSRELE
jgi:hypothetical protein